MAREAEEVVPRDAQLIQNLLADQGVTDYEPRVVHQLLSLLYRECSTLLQDAEAYYDSAGRPGQGLDAEDVTLAIQARDSFTFTGPPPKHVMMELAEQINSRPLPAIRSSNPRAGLLIPPDEDALLAQNLRLRVGPARLTDADVSITPPPERQKAADGPRALLPGRARVESFGVRRSAEAQNSGEGAFGADGDDEQEPDASPQHAGGPEAMDLSPGAQDPGAEAAGAAAKPPEQGADDDLADALLAELDVDVEEL